MKIEISCQNYYFRIFEKTKHFPLQKQFFEENKVENYNILIDNIISAKDVEVLCYK